jgi:RND family efflux transporter MFP subunit
MNGISAKGGVLDEARVENVQQWREVTGDLRAVRRSTLAAETEGLVLELLVDAGDGVEEGQVVARLKDTLIAFAADSAEATLRRRRAAVRLREAELTKARRDFVQREELAARGGAKQNEVADAQTVVDASEARLAEAEAEVAGAEVALADARERLANMQIRAPFAGHVIAKQTEVGQWLQEGDPVAEIVQTDVVEAWLDVPERYIAALSPGEATVQVRIEALGEVREAMVAAIVPLADSLSRLFPVRVVLPNEDGLLRPGMSATGLVPTGSSGGALTVHKDAILRHDAGTYVYFAQQTSEGGSVAAVAPVQVLFAAGDRVAVRSARLTGGEQIVIEGNERMYPTQPLEVVRPEGEGDARPGAPGKGEGG